jgi:hypothetical protein
LLNGFISEASIKEILRGYDQSITIYINTCKEQLYDNFISDEIQTLKLEINAIVEVHKSFHQV